MMLTDFHFGNYANTIIELGKRLTALGKPPDKLKVMAVGHSKRTVGSRYCSLKQWEQMTYFAIMFKL